MKALLFVIASMAVFMGLGALTGSIAAASFRATNAILDRAL